MWNSPVPQGLGDAVRVVQRRHLLVAGFRVDADHVRVLALVDERDGMPDRGQQDVPARLVRLRLDREFQSVALVDRVLGEHVDALPVPVQGGPDVLGEVDLGAFPAAPEHVDLGAQLGSQIHVAHDLAERVPADGAVVGGEPAVLEHRIAEQVGGDHRHDHPGVGQRLLELGDDGVAFRGGALRWDEIVVVESDPVRAQLGQLVHGGDPGHHRPGGFAEQVPGLPANRPQPEAELVGGGGLRSHSGVLVVGLRGVGHGAERVAQPTHRGAGRQLHLPSARAGVQPRPRQGDHGVREADTWFVFPLAASPKRGDHRLTTVLRPTIDR